MIVVRGWRCGHVAPAPLPRFPLSRQAQRSKLEPSVPNQPCGRPSLVCARVYHSTHACALASARVCAEMHIHTHAWPFISPAHIHSCLSSVNARVHSFSHRDMAVAENQTVNHSFETFVRTVWRSDSCRTKTPESTFSDLLFGVAVVNVSTWADEVAEGNPLVVRPFGVFIYLATDAYQGGKNLLELLLKSCPQFIPASVSVVDSLGKWFLGINSTKLPDIDASWLCWLLAGRPFPIQYFHHEDSSEVYGMLNESLSGIRNDQKDTPMLTRVEPEVKVFLRPSSAAECTSQLASDCASPVDSIIHTCNVTGYGRTLADDMQFVMCTYGLNTSVPRSPTHPAPKRRFPLTHEPHSRHPRMTVFTHSWACCNLRRTNH